MKRMSNVRFTSFPRTEPPPPCTLAVVEAFRGCEPAICTKTLQKGLTSDAVLAAVGPALAQLGFLVEGSKLAVDKIKRPVFFGENGSPDLQYEIDAFHPEWRCGLEIEAGRGWMGNAVYRDLVQALVMVELETLILAVANSYRYKSSGRATISKDYANTIAVADALFGHSRIRMPYQLVVIGYSNYSVFTSAMSNEAWRPKGNEPWPDVPTVRRRVMASIRAKDTKPEIKVRQLLHGLGYRFRTHMKGLPGTPDLAFTRRRKVVFVHGCFWHGHDECGVGRIPKTRSEHWRRKLEANKARDVKYLGALEALGWNTIVVWECQLADSDSLRRRLCAFLGPPSLTDASSDQSCPSR